MTEIEWVHYDLWSLLSMGKFEHARKYLKDHRKDVDVLYEKGVFFRFVFSKNDPDTLRELLKLAEETKIQNAPDTLEYKIFNHKFRETIEEVIEDERVSEESKTILTEYGFGFEQESDSDREKDLRELEDEFDYGDYMCSYAQHGGKLSKYLVHREEHKNALGSGKYDGFKTYEELAFHSEGQNYVQRDDDLQSIDFLGDTHCNEHEAKG